MFWFTVISLVWVVVFQAFMHLMLHKGFVEREEIPNYVLWKGYAYMVALSACLWMLSNGKVWLFWVIAVVSVWDVIYHFMQGRKK